MKWHHIGAWLFRKVVALMSLGASLCGIVLAVMDSERWAREPNAQITDIIISAGVSLLAISVLALPIMETKK